MASQQEIAEQIAKNDEVIKEKQKHIEFYASSIEGKTRIIVNTQANINTLQKDVDVWKGEIKVRQEQNEKLKNELRELIDPIAVLEEVKRRIMAEPKRFNMQWWHYHADGREIPEEFNNKKEVIEECGTAHCIGGWIQVITGKYDGCIKSIVSDVLNLPMRVVENLCTRGGWDEDLQLIHRQIEAGEYDGGSLSIPYRETFNTNKAKSLAMIACMQIDRFIDKHLKKKNDDVPLVN